MTPPPPPDPVDPEPLTNSFTKSPTNLSIRSKLDAHHAEQQTRGGVVPHNIRQLTQAGAGARYAEMSNTDGHVVLLGIYVAGAPCDFSVNNYVRVEEDTLENGFASGTTILFQSYALANNYKASASGTGKDFMDLNIYSDKDLRVTCNVKTGAAATEAVSIVCVFLDESGLSYTTTGSDPGWDA